MSHLTFFYANPWRSQENSLKNRQEDTCTAERDLGKTCLVFIPENLKKWKMKYFIVQKFDLEKQLQVSVSASFSKFQFFQQFQTCKSSLSKSYHLHREYGNVKRLISFQEQIYWTMKMMHQAHFLCYIVGIVLKRYNKAGKNAMTALMLLELTPTNTAKAIARCWHVYLPCQAQERNKTQN